MKVTPSTPSTFTPVALTITFETQNELNALGALLNVGVVADAMRAIHGFDPKPLREAIQAAGGDALTGISRYLGELKA